MYSFNVHFAQAQTHNDDEYNFEREFIEVLHIKTPICSRILISSGVASLTLMPGHRYFTHNITTCLDAGPTFMKAQKIMHIQYNLC